jgi:hypothetical protein
MLRHYEYGVRYCFSAHHRSAHGATSIVPMALSGDTIRPEMRAPPFPTSANSPWPSDPWPVNVMVSVPQVTLFSAPPWITIRISVSYSTPACAIQIPFKSKESADANVKACARTAESLFGFATTTSTVPADRGGAQNRIVALSRTDTLAATPPNVTRAPGWNPAPEIAPHALPSTEPVVGVIAVRVGACDMGAGTGAATDEGAGSGEGADTGEAAVGEGAEPLQPVNPTERINMISEA